MESEKEKNEKIRDYDHLLDELRKERQAREKAENFLAVARKELDENLRETREFVQSSTARFRSQKMNALGLMAGGVAHDLNNILCGIVSYPDLLLMQLPSDSPLRPSIEIIKESASRAAHVVADLLTVARGVDSTRQVADLNDIVTTYLESSDRLKLSTMYPGVIFDIEQGANLLHIKCSSSYLERIVSYLVSNGAEAVNGEGTVRLSTYNRYLDRPQCGYETIRPGEYVVLSIFDTGDSIAGQDMERIFEPFYAKKIMGRRNGRGLGLAVVWNTIRDHDGYLNVSSNEKGTCFELYFPATKEKAHSQAKTLQQVESSKAVSPALPAAS